MGGLGDAEEVGVEPERLSGGHEGQRHEKQLHKALGIHDDGCVSENQPWRLKR